MASVSGLQITASRGTRIVADCILSECHRQTFDQIVLPGGIPGAEYLRDSGELIELLKLQQRQERWIAAICASPAVVLQHHNLLEGIKATCHPNFAHMLANNQPLASRVVVDRKCVTSRGPGTAMEFALKLVEILFGEEKARKVAQPLVMRDD